MNNNFFLYYTLHPLLKFADSNKSRDIFKLQPKQLSPQSGPVPEQSTMEPIFCVRNLLEEECREVKINLTVVFSDLENACNRITKKKTRVLKKKRVRLCMQISGGFYDVDLHQGAQTVHGNTGSWDSLQMFSTVRFEHCNRLYLNWL